MNIHLLVLLVIMSITLFFSKYTDNSYNRKVVIFMVASIMTFFTGLRSWWMGDLIKYFTLYRNCNGKNWVEYVFVDYVNSGIKVFFRVVGGLGLSYEICLFTISAFSVFTLSYMIFKYSPSLYWSYFIYIAMGFYTFTYSGLKQTIAMAFILLAGDAIFQSKPMKFTLWTCLAGIFHAPAFIFLPSYILAKRKISRNYILVLGIAIVVIYYYRNQIIELFTKAYYEEEVAYQVTKVIGGRAIMMILILLLAMVLRPPAAGDRIYMQLFNLMVISVLIQYFSIYNNVFTRLADYYYQFAVLFMAMMLESGRHQVKINPNPGYKVRSYDPMIYFLLGISITVFGLWFYRNSLGSTLVTTYKFFWEINPYQLYGL